MKIKGYLIIVLLLASLACSLIQPSTATLPTQSAVTEPPAATEPAFVPLPPEPQRIEFQAEDGAALVGYYYPASIPNAPVVVLMHWVRGDQTDWTKVGLVQWLQNRGSGGGLNAPAPQTSIYPPMPQGVYFAVFTFDFRGFGESSGMKAQWTPDLWLLDAEAAYQKAGELPEVDPNRIAGIGSSFGADAVVDTCGDDCLGALSLSPGGYLGTPYAEAVAKMEGDADNFLYFQCIATEGDSEAAPACRAASGDNYKAIIYPGSAHGTALLMEPTAPPDIGQVILDWLLLTFNSQQ